MGHRCYFVPPKPVPVLWVTRVNNQALKQPLRVGNPKPFLQGDLDLDGNGNLGTHIQKCESAKWSVNPSDSLLRKPGLLTTEAITTHLKRKLISFWDLDEKQRPPRGFPQYCQIRIRCGQVRLGRFCWPSRSPPPSRLWRYLPPGPSSQQWPAPWTGGRGQRRNSFGTQGRVGEPKSKPTKHGVEKLAHAYAYIHRIYIYIFR